MSKQQSNFINWKDGYMSLFNIQILNSINYLMLLTENTNSGLEINH